MCEPLKHTRYKSNSGRFTLIELLACQGEARRAKRSMSFTLIELLVVIAIIAILASLLLPTLARARYNARVVVCVNQLRQMALAWTTYADEYDEFYPDYGDAKQDALQTNVHQLSRTRLMQWAKNPSSAYAQGGDLRPVMSPYFGGDLDKITVCPLAAPGWQSGVAKNNGANLKLEYKNADGSYSFSHWSGNPASSYSIWAQRNERMNIAPFSQVMRKPGDAFKPRDYNPDNLEYTILIADYFAWQNPYGGRSLFGPKSNHFSFGGGSIENGDSADYFWYGWDTLPDEVLTTNYAMADGSVKIYWHLIPNKIKYDGSFHRGHHSKGHFIPVELAE